MEHNKHAEILGSAALDDRINDAQYRLLALIYQLSRKRGYAFPSNAFLADALNKSPATTTRNLSAIKMAGYIRIEYNNGSRGEDGRRIYFADSHPGQPAPHQPSRGGQSTPLKNEEGTLLKNEDPAQKRGGTLLKNEEGPCSKMSTIRDITLREKEEVVTPGRENSENLPQVDLWEMPKAERNLFLARFVPDDLDQLCWLFRERPSQRVVARWVQMTEAEKAESLKKAPLHVAAATQARYVGRLYNYLTQQKFKQTYEPIQQLDAEAQRSERSKIIDQAFSDFE